MCIREPCAETWAQSSPRFFPLSFISLHHPLSAANSSLCSPYSLHLFSSLIPFHSPCLLSLSVFPPPSHNPTSSLTTPSPALSLSISLHQLQRAVSVADLEGTCLLRWNKIMHPLVLLCVCVCVCVAGTDSEVQWCPRQLHNKQTKQINKLVNLPGPQGHFCLWGYSLNEIMLQCCW